MSHKENFEVVNELLKENYECIEGTSIPLKEDLTFDNKYKKINSAVVVYLDMRGSRKIMFEQNEYRSLKTHRAFLQSFISCVDMRGGKFRSFNGDGALAFFYGEDATAKAVTACMEFQCYIVKMNEILTERGMLNIDYGVGIDRGTIYVAKTGKKGGDLTKQDLVWVGTPTYHAVELSDLGKSSRNTWITDKVYNLIQDQDKDSKYNILTSDDGKINIWNKDTITYDDGSIGTAYYTSYYFSGILG
jgi:class 3 adenylate cyclase